MKKNPDVIIIGAGASGLMCAIEAAKRGREVLILDHANKVGKKILMSGGGRCNFTNLYISPDKYLSHNKHFVKSALSRYTQWDFIDLVQKYKIPYHEKTLGQLFCDSSAKDIVNMLLQELERVGGTINLLTKIESITKHQEGGFSLKTNQGSFKCESLVIASGGLSIPTMGATPFAYHVAKQFGIKVWPTRAGLVPFTLDVHDKERLSPLSGISAFCSASFTSTSFQEHMLFTHRGLSGPAMLQISSFWQPGECLEIDLCPQIDLEATLKSHRDETPLRTLNTVLQHYFPKRLIDVWSYCLPIEKRLADLSNQHISKIAKAFKSWQIKPNATEGYRTAEVTLGGVDCDAISSKTMMSHDTENLYFIGEALDVAGWLGGYNFQWAWSSGWACGQVA